MAGPVTPMSMRSLPGVRAFDERDRPALRQIFLLSRTRAFHWLDTRGYRLADFDTETAGERIWVAVRAEWPIGFAAVYERNCFLHSLFVHPDHSGCGAGSALLTAVRGALPGRLQLKCLTRNAPALAFYQRHGFTVAGNGASANGDYLLLAAPD